MLEVADIVRLHGDQARDWLAARDGLLLPDGSRWLRPKNPAFLVPVRALSPVFRAKLCAALKKAGLLEETPPKVWRKPWVVHCQPAGSGEKALHYLGRYVFRVALSNSRLQRIDDGLVTFRYRDSRTSRMRRVTLPAVEFLRRFLQHALPKGCVKVRYYGIWSHSCGRLLDRAQTLLQAPPQTIEKPDSAKKPASSTLQTVHRAPNGHRAVAVKPAKPSSHPIKNPNQGCPSRFSSTQDFVAAARDKNP